MDTYIQEIVVCVVLGFTAIVILTVIVKIYSNIIDKRDIDSPERVLYQKIIK